MGIRLKSLNKKSISFYNNFAFNEFNSKNLNDKYSIQKNQQSQYDLFNINSNNGRNSYGNIKTKNKNANTNANKSNSNKYHYSSEDKYKIKLGRPINICTVNTNNNNINKNNKRHANDLIGKKLIHNLTEDLLSSENKRKEMPNINSKNKINNAPNVKKLNFI